MSHSCSSPTSRVAVALLAGLVLSPMAFGAPTSAGNEALFTRLDTDKDGVISSDEVAGTNSRLFDRLLRRADADHDRRLTHDEFIEGLVPSAPEKPIEAKQPTTLPGASAVKYLLLTMDTSGNSMIEADEVPDDLMFVYETLAERVDRNNNDRIERQELDRAGPVLSAVANRYVDREGIDADAELKKLAKAQGDAADRFEQPPISFDQLRDPKQARKIFAQLDTDSNGQIERGEIPPQLEQPLERFSRLADRDRDGKLSEREFVVGAQRISTYFGGGTPAQSSSDMRKKDGSPKKATSKKPRGGRPKTNGA